MKKTPLIMICNDDGYFSKGIKNLREALEPLGRVITVAPDQDCSGVSHKITINTALRLRSVEKDVYTVTGTPVDCVHLGIHGVLNGQLPDILVSGINHGANLGEDTAYSGTVAAAYEGFLHHIPSMAISTGRSDEGSLDFGNAKAVAHYLVKSFLEGDPLLRKAVWNINAPSGKIKGSRIVRLDKRSFKSSVVKRSDPRGMPYYWIGPYFPKFENTDDTDFAAFNSNFVTMTPLKVEMTNYEILEDYEPERDPFPEIFR